MVGGLSARSKKMGLKINADQTRVMQGFRMPRANLQAEGATGGSRQFTSACAKK